jgi:UDP-N-acetylmuramoyl-L-alanyl-D-glutamate--2,6-diaminopimelate ligase
MNNILRKIKKLIPKKVFTFFQPIYHWKLALLGTLIYRFPSKKIKVVAVTGTKGKTSTVEFVNAILEEAGFITALAGTLRFKIRDNSKPNMYKMTMPGRFFIQRFLRQAVDAHCDYAILEISSEAAKLSIAHALEKSGKKNKIIVANIDDKEGHKFLNINVEKKVPYSLKDGEPIVYHDNGVNFVYENIKIQSKLPGKFNVYNMLAAISYTRALGITMETIKAGLEKVVEIKGRAQKISNNLGIDVVVDYAHTPDSLKALYTAFQNKKKICVLGNCGGGRDKWKRKEMAQIADKYCDQIILTDEDPYDDDPQEIVADMAKWIKDKKPKIIIDRREAISSAIKKARAGDAVLITGKGTDPYIMRKNGAKEPWSDAKVAEEEILKIKN